MRISFIFLFINIFLVPAWAQEDKEGSQDHLLFSRMNNFYIYEYNTQSHEIYSFYTNNGSVEVGGKYTYIGYWANKQIEANPPSNATIIKNYINAAKKIGGEVLYESSSQAIVKIKKNNMEIWADIQANSISHRIKIVEKEAMKQEVIANAEWMKGGLEEEGRVVLYGILFDFGKSVVRPESNQVIGEIAKLLKNNPLLTIFVVGHTDNVGDHASNLKLSNDRAVSVVNVLTSQHGIPAKQVIPFGAGQTCPVANNNTEEGRQKNRRVELVKK
ncbi:MAG: OmpA family protein [Thermoflexibacter sp.]|jgi:outer membrane protein OmpA-like peptidoglycan-associated protein|nr:OmpA family protein [Thermoflexibacter sp.]